MSVTRRSLQLTGLYEAELLTELMLRYWDHPLANNPDYRNDLLETATQALQHAADGGRLLDSLSPENTNLVAAIWYAEWAAMRASAAEDPGEVHGKRQRWLDELKRAIPSCFTDDIV
jgi:hypothetical protein